MNIPNKLILISIFITCCNSSEIPNDETIKKQICQEIKEVYCSKLLECNGIDKDMCLTIASSDERCESSNSSIEELRLCEDLMRDAECQDGVPQFCKDLQGT